MQSRAKAAVAIVLLAASVGAVLHEAGPSVSEVRRFAADPQAFVDRDGADRAVVLLAGLALWVVAAWLLLALVLCVLAALPGLPGTLRSVVEPIAGAVAPRVLRSVVVTAIGVGLTAAPAYAGTASGPAATHSVSTQVVSAYVVPTDVSVDWPTTATTTAATSAPTGPVVVVRGDCLWSIVADRLGPGADDATIATEVGRWYAANAQVIGTDPDLIRPGMVLQPPPAT